MSQKRFGEDVQRIAHLFDLRGTTLNEDELCLVTRCSTNKLRSLVADGSVSAPRAGRFAWNDAAYVAAHVQWTPRFVAEALALSAKPDAVPPANRYAPVQYELPSYLRTLLNTCAERTRGRRMKYSPSDLLERIVADYFDGELSRLPARAVPTVKAALNWPLDLEDD